MEEHIRGTGQGGWEEDLAVVSRMVRCPLTSLRCVMTSGVCLPIAARGSPRQTFSAALSGGNITNL